MADSYIQSDEGFNFEYVYERDYSKQTEEELEDFAIRFDWLIQRMPADTPEQRFKMAWMVATHIYHKGIERKWFDAILTKKPATPKL